MKKWTVLTQYVEDWLLSLDDAVYADVIVALTYLEEVGPQGGRPIIDRIKNSKIHNLKELRPRGAARTVRILFVFDPDQDAILLCAGDKKGTWNSWYHKNIRVAEKNYLDHLSKKGIS